MSGDGDADGGNGTGDADADGGDQAGDGGDPAGDGGGGNETSDAGGGRSGEMTLVFTLAAIRRFEEPRAVFTDAREWSRYVGIVDNDTDAVASFTDEYGIRQDFELGDADKWLAMEEMRAATDTPRHVFVGTTVEDRRIANHVGWEYRQPQTVAEKADWTLAGEGADSGGGGLVERLRSLLPGGSA
jgi:hypothetical protein